MAKDKIVIAELDIDTRALIESASRTAKQIESLKEQQEKLMNKGKETSQQFVANAAALKSLEAGYRTQQSAIAAQVAEEVKLVAQKKAVAQAVNVVNNSENAYITNNRQLIELKKQLRTTDENYEKRLDAINTKLAENTNWLNQNGSANTKLAFTYNDFKQKVADSFDQINIFNGGLGGFISRAQEAGGVGPLLKGSFDGMSSGIIGMTKAAWGFVTNPIGAVITAIVLAVQAGIAIFKDFTPIVNKVEQVMAGVGAIAESVKNSFIALFTGAQSLGDFFSGFAGSAASAAGEAMKLKAAQQELNDQMELQEITNEKAASQIEELIRQSEDMSLTEKQRADAVKKAGQIEADTYKQNKKLKEDAYNQAVNEFANGKNLTQQEIKLLKEKGTEYAKELMQRKQVSQEDIDALKKAETEKIKIEREGIALHKKQQDAKLAEDAKRLDDEQKKKDDAQRKDEDRRRRAEQYLSTRAEREKLLFELFMQQQDDKVKSLQQELDLASEIARRNKAIADADYRASEKKYNDRLRLQIAYGNASNEEDRSKSEATAKYAQSEFDLWMSQNQSKLQNGAIVTKELLKQEQERLEKVKGKALEKLITDKDISEAEIKIKQSTNQQLTLQENEFLIELENLNRQYEENKENINKMISAKAFSDKQAQLEAEAASAETKYQEDLIKEDMRYEAEIEKLKERRDQGLITQQQYEALELDQKQKTQDSKDAIEAAALDNKLNLAQMGLSNMATILGKESAAGKAVAVAQATIDTYKAAVAAYAAGVSVGGPAGLVLGPVSAGLAVGAGLANVKKIVATKEPKAPKAERGALFTIGGNRHSAGGTMFTGQDGTRFEAEQGELIGVMNRNAARHFMAFNNAFPAGGSSTPNYFAGGGIVSREIAPQGLNIDELAGKIAQANATLPAPVVAVQDIIAQGDSYVKVRDAANF